jgi:hypothetical protein
MGSQTGALTYEPPNSTVAGGAAAPRLGGRYPTNLLINLGLLSAQRPRRGARTSATPVRPGFRLAGGHWPGAPSRAVRFPAALLALAASLAGAGCGRGNAPCPTPPATLDSHRVQSEKLQQDLGQVSAEGEELEVRREEAVGRIQAAKAFEDSLTKTPQNRRSR